MPGKLLHIDDERVVIATVDSDNRKTGDMIQVWILVRSTLPVAARKTGLDALVCGDCPHRSGTCYVNIGQAPGSIWRAFQRGAYEFLGVADYSAFFHGRKVRFGAYGDPAFVPLEILSAIASASSGWTGYTHQWRKCDADYRNFLMASVDSASEYLLAKSQGWRTFRVRKPGDFPLILNEITCPASDEAGHRTQCERCLLCDGSRGVGDRRKDITILVHGAQRKNFVSLEALHG